MRPIHLALFVSLTALTSGCASSAQPTAWVELQGHRYDVELAKTEDQRERGLMFRDTMAGDHGMLFIHDREEPQAYWMKNTKIPLDILYFDNGLKLVAQQRNVPPCTMGDQCPPYPSNVPARYVLELNAGQADAMDLKDGSVMAVKPGVTPSK